MNGFQAIQSLALPALAAATLVLGSALASAESPDRDCITFDPDNLQMQRSDGNFFLIDGDHRIRDFGSDAYEARQAFRVFRHYEIDRHCFVGRPNPSLTYLLADGDPPAGPINREDCNRFDPDNVRTRNIRGTWRIVDGRHSLFSFGDSRSEAREALAIIRHHGFNHSCFVGRPGPVLTYMRVDEAETTASGPRRTIPQIDSMAGERPPSSDESVTDTLAEMMQPPEQDCVSFNPDNTQARQVNGRWKVTDGGHQLLDFDQEGRQARLALTLIRHYGMDESCFVSRPNAAMRYFLVDGKAPSGEHRLEDCGAFDPDQVEAARVRGNWRVVAGDRWLLNFDNDRADAEKAAKIIQYYGFTHNCFVGRPDPDMQYFRR